MKEKIISFIKKNGLTIWITLAIIALISLPIYAAYMRTQTAKRVISTMSGLGNRFSSNRLEALESDSSALEFRFLTITGAVPTGGIDRDLTICNYPQGLESSYYPFDIYYTVELELTDSFGNASVFTDEASALAQYFVVDPEGNTRYFTKNAQTGKYMLSIGNQSLKGNKTSFNSYTLHFPDKDTGVYMKSFVRPTIDNNGTKIQPSDLKSIGAMISAVSVSASTDNNWTGELTEPRESGKTVSDYDAFNYVVTGSGAGTITIKWDADMLELNPFYVENEGIAEAVTERDGDGYKTLSFTVTASQTKNRYSFQMYRVADSDWSNIGFDDIANATNANNPLIKFDFTAAAQN